MMFKVGFKKYFGVFICSFVFFIVGIVNVCEASMYRTMVWTGAGVAISNSAHTAGYENMCKLITYSKSEQQGSVLDNLESVKTVTPATLTSTNRSNKSTYSEHYTYDNNKIVQKKIYYRNKGNGYTYDD